MENTVVLEGNQKRKTRKQPESGLKGSLLSCSHFNNYLECVGQLLVLLPQQDNFRSFFYNIILIVSSSTFPKKKSFQNKININK
jgi:hypothetical protein